MPYKSFSSRSCSGQATDFIHEERTTTCIDTQPQRATTAMIKIVAGLFSVEDLHLAVVMFLLIVYRRTYNESNMFAARAPAKDGKTWMGYHDPINQQPEMLAELDAAGVAITQSLKNMLEVETAELSITWPENQLVEKHGSG